MVFPIATAAVVAAADVLPLLISLVALDWWDGAGEGNGNTDKIEPILGEKACSKSERR